MKSKKLDKEKVINFIKEFRNGLYAKENNGVDIVFDDIENELEYFVDMVERGFYDAKRD